MSIRVELQTEDWEEVRKAIALRLNRPTLSDEEVRTLLHCLKANMGSNDSVIFDDQGKQRSSFAIRPKNTGYHISVENAALLSAAFLLDTFLTGGAASALLAASGKKLQAISIISTVTGRLCNYVTLEQLASKASPVSPEQLLEVTLGKACRHPQHSCCYCTNGLCQITLGAVRQNLKDLSDSAVVELNDHGKVTRLCF